MSIVQEYIDIYNKYTSIYGKNNVIVIMHVGSFYEMYATPNEGPNLFNISNILNVVCTRKNTKINEINIKNPYLLGFPVVSALSKIQQLINNNYNVVVIDQTTTKPIERKISCVYTTGTFIENIDFPDTNNIMCIYMTYEQQFNKKKSLCAGLSVCDLSTGKCNIYDIYDSNDDNYTINEIIRLNEVIQPKEIIICGLYDEQIINKINFNKEIIRNMKLSEHISKLSYQNEFLKKVYGDGLLSPIESLNLSKYPFSIISLISLLEYAFNHDENILKKIHKPKIMENNKYLLLENNAIYQLNLFDNKQTTSKKNINSLFSIIDKTSTPLGKRYLKYRLSLPFINKDDIQPIYDLTELFIKDNLYIEIEKYLNQITDIERLSRKLFLSKIHPYELFNLISSYNNVIQLTNILNDISFKQKPTSKIINKLNIFLKLCNKTFKIDELKKQNLSDISSSFFNPTIYKDIDDIQSKLDDGFNLINNIQTTLSSLINDKIYLKHNNRDGYYLNMTNKRADLLKKKIKDLNFLNVNGVKIDIKLLEFSNFNKNTKILLNKVKESHDVGDINNQLIKLVTDHYIEFLEEITKKYYNTFIKINSFIEFIDYIKSNAKNAKLNNYIKPSIIDNNCSFIKCKELRHPIIEQLIDYTYIPHDIHLGNELKGILLYGLNSCGKSSLMKAIGISVIMAQAGLYVPATTFEYNPYKLLFTRITGADDIINGLSSFSVEMLELQNIIKRANSSSLIIGDEICRSTEHVSGNAIVASAIINISKKEASFIFATHLHDLVKIKEINDIITVKPYHLSVMYDDDEHELIYERRLKEGSGDPIYGVEVAKYLIKDDDFISKAQSIKNLLLNQSNTIIKDKISKYNKNIFVYECKLCGNKINLETHHLKEQHEFDGYETEMNRINNLIVICKECHTKIHKEKIKFRVNKSGKGNKLMS